jgi:hypothetical protein
VKISRKGEWLTAAIFWRIRNTMRWCPLRGFRWAKDQFGRKVIMLKIPFVGLFGWAYARCNCGHCIDRRQRTLRKMVV